MPFVIIVGLPASGKTTVTENIANYFRSKGKTIEIVSESNIMKSKNLCRNTTYVNSKIEKELRGSIKTEVLRNLAPDSILILDGLNYIKGFRYELYCGSKTSKTTNCTVHCEPGSAKAWEYNLLKAESERYSKEVFDGLVQRYEEPDSRNRWDSPMITVIDSHAIPLGDLESALFDRKPPPPNQSTQCPPLSDTNFLHEVDRTVQAIISEVNAAVKIGGEGEVAVSGSTEKVVIGGEKNASLPQLMRLKRQFITYVKAHPELRSDSIPTCFVQYLNTNL